MNDLQILNAITSEFSVSFTACSVEYPNTSLDVRDLNEWVRISVKGYAAVSLNLAKSRAKRTGVVYIQAFTKQKIGSGRATELAVIAATVFESKMIGGIEFDFASITDIGNGVSDSLSGDETGWYQVNAAIDYKVIT